jgi:hypothetical protein
MYGHVELVSKLADRCQDRWPEAMFLEPMQVSEVERDAVWRAMRVCTLCMPSPCCSREHFQLQLSSAYAAGFLGLLEKIKIDVRRPRACPAAPRWVLICLYSFRMNHGWLASNSHPLCILYAGEKAPWRQLIGMPLPNDGGFFTNNWVHR